MIVAIKVVQTTTLSAQYGELCIVGQDIAVAAACPLSKMVGATTWQINNASLSEQVPYLPEELALVSSQPDGFTNWRRPHFWSWDDAHGTSSALGTEIERNMANAFGGPGSFQNWEWVKPSATGNGYESIGVGGFSAPPVWSANPAYPQADGVNPVIANGGPNGPTVTFGPGFDGYLFPNNALNAAQQPLFVLFRNGVPVTQPVLGVGVPNRLNPSATLAFDSTLGINQGANPFRVAQISTVEIPLFLRVTLTEVPAVAPWQWDFKKSWTSTGFWGCSSMNVNFQLQPLVQARLIQSSSQRGCAMIGPYCTNFGQNGVNGMTQYQPSTASSQTLMQIESAQMYTINHSCPEEIFQPPMCTHPWTLKTYVQQTQTSGPVFGAWLPQVTKLIPIQVTFNNTVFTAIPHTLCISFRPVAASLSPTEADAMCNMPDQPFSQFNFANIPGALQGWKPFATNTMFQKNGCNAMLCELGGANASGYMNKNGRYVVPGGSMAVLTPGVDFQVPNNTGQGTTGQVQFNFNCSFLIPQDRAREYVCTVLGLIAGFIFLENGSTTTSTLGMVEKDWLTAPYADGSAGSTSPQHLIGGGFFDMMHKYGSKALDAAHAAASMAEQHGIGGKYASMAKSGLGMARNVRDSLGYGGGMAGGSAMRSSQMIRR